MADCFGQGNEGRDSIPEHKLRPDHTAISGTNADRETLMTGNGSGMDDTTIEIAPVSA